MKILVILVIFSLHRNTKNKGKKLWFSSSMAIYHLRKIGAELILLWTYR
ncbi:hypothetical protein V6Z12_A08G032900 [Gossypium hirsutum]